MRTILRGAEPFFFPKGEVGCLLIHGYTGTPFEMREMGEYLAECGFTTMGVRLFGHATRKQDLYRVQWQDWVACVEDGYQMLRGIVSHVFLIGFSMGALLAVYLSSYSSIRGLIIISAPFHAPDPRLQKIGPYLPFIRRFYRAYPKSGSHWDDRHAAATHIEYDAYPLPGVHEMGTMMKHAVSLLPEIQVPTLLIHSLRDQSVGFNHAELIMKTLGTSHKRLIILERSAHNIPRDSEKQMVFEKSATFISQVLEGSPL